jgi:hypothetical protein
MTSRASIEPLECQRLRQLIEKAVRRGDAADVLAHLQSSESLPTLERGELLGLQVLGQGFGGGMSSPDRVSFAHYCMKNLQETVLEAVLRSDLAERQVLATKVCAWHSMVFSKRNGRPAAAARGRAAHSLSMLDSAARLTSAVGMRLAIEFESHSQRLREPVKRNPLTPAKTCHADALDFAMAYVRNPGFDQSLEVCRVFVENRLPATASDSVNFVLEKLTSVGGASVNRESMRTLFRLYEEAGYIVDVDKPLGSASNGLLPLTAAILEDNRELALELIRVGADVTLVGVDVDMPGADILDVIGAQNHARGGEFVAEVANLLMAREIASHAPWPTSAESANRRRSLRV